MNTEADRNIPVATKNGKLRFRPVLFWDADISKLDPEKHSGQIVPRVFMRGEPNEMKDVMTYYGIERIKKILMQTRYLDKVTLGFASNFFTIPKEDFRCYKLSQSTPKHWNF